MKLSWDIQRTRQYTRSKALLSAWAILLNEDTTIQYLTQRLNHYRPLKKDVRGQMALFGA